jgi:hypothetical protein
MLVKGGGGVLAKLNVLQKSLIFENPWFFIHFSSAFVEQIDMGKKKKNLLTCSINEVYFLKLLINVTTCHYTLVSWVTI